MEPFEKRIFLGLTGKDNLDWKEKLKEVEKFNIDTIAVFLSRFDEQERDNFYRFLEKSKIKKIPLVHIRDDTSPEEINYFKERYGTRYFNIHEHNFSQIDQWQENLKDLYLEMDYSNSIEKNVIVRKIGGFCIDLAHFMGAIERGSEEAVYIFNHKDSAFFDCNHIGGYCQEKMQDMHYIDKKERFDYLRKIPEYVLGKVMSLEVDNPIEEQIEFREYIIKLLNDTFFQKS